MTDLHITYIGGPTMLLDVGGTRLLTDPTFDPAGSEYASGPATLRKLSPPALQPEQLPSFDYVLLSHDQHFDNLDRAGHQSLQLAELVFTTPEGAQRLGGNAIGMDAWDSRDLRIADRTLRIVATPARHGPAGMERGAVIGFVVFFTDLPEQSLYISGDTVWYEGVEQVAQRFRITTAILHIGAARVPEVGPFHLTMTSEEAVLAAKAFPEATIIPTHFEGWEHFSEGKREILRAFRAAGMEQRLCWPKAGEAVEVRPSQNLRVAG
jgi:L-ascorbate metabolism protein UlaG (beta-lactamase superfamily)